MNTNYDKIVELLKSNNQTKILNILNKSNDKNKEILIKQLLKIDFNKINDLYKESKEKPEILDKKLEHMKYVDKSKLSKDIESEYTKIGENIIKNNEYAVVTMAGGQGTRLGHKGPKGTFILDIQPEPKSIFQILAEGLKKANKKYGITLNWYIMTSTENNKETVDFFKENDYFGYPNEYIKFFIQGDLPVLFPDGNLILNKDYSIKFASDGNGCVYQAMSKNNVIDDMCKKGIKWVFIGSVDNVLLDMVDPILIGLTISEGNQIGSKSVSKKDPKEKVGVFCKANGKPGIIEYSELPTELSIKRDDDGELLFGEANITCHLYSIDALKSLSDKKLPYHVAFKKISYLDENENFIEAKEPNAYKFEAFIFDAFCYFDNMSILRVKREESFAPVKNKEGNDSPETAIKLYNEFHKK